MFKKIIFNLIFVFIFSYLFVYADGFIIPIDNGIYIPIVKQDIISVKYHKVNVEINNNIAKVSIDQVFKNETNRVIEGSYIFPMPDKYNILNFAMYINGKKVSGKIYEKNKARRIYEDIVRKMKDPALLEYNGKKTFRLRIYPINPYEEKRIKIVYYTKIDKVDDFYRFVYPLDIEKYSYKPIKEVIIKVFIKNKFNKIRSIYCPYYDIQTKNKGKIAQIVYKGKNVKPDKDFVLYYNFSENDISISYLSYKDLLDNEKYFALFISPNPLIDTKKVLAKDIIFVIDKSGSMGDDVGNFKTKMYYAKKGLKFILSNLSKLDRFNIISFSTQVNSLFTRLKKVNLSTKNKALRYVDKLTPLGGTNIYDALSQALDKFSANSKNPKYIIFLTDGIPTVGTINIDEILKVVKSKNKGKIKLFVFGIGYDVNTKLLDNLAKQNKGFADYLKAGKELELKLSSFYKKIAYPVLSEVKIKFYGIKPYSVFPKEVPDIFVNTQLMLIGKYKGNNRVKVLLTGKKGKKIVKQVYRFNLKANNSNKFLPKLWASRRIGYLLDLIEINGQNKELIDEIIALSKKYAIITPYTSFLVTEPQLSDNRAADKFYESMPKGYVGRSAVRRSKLKQSLQYNAKVSSPVVNYEGGGKTNLQIAKKVKYIDSIAFYYRNKKWIQYDYKNQKTIKIKYLSKQYFKILNKYNKLSKILSLGKNIIFKLNGKWYEIN